MTDLFVAGHFVVFNSSQNFSFCSLVKNFPKKMLKNAFQKIKALFLRKENVPEIMESVPKWNDLERILLPLKRVLGRSEMERSRTYSVGFETLSICFGTFSLLSNKLHLWTHSRSSADKSLIHQKTIFNVTR